MRALALTAGMAISVLVFAGIVAIFDTPRTIDRVEVRGDCSLPKRPNEIVTKDVRMIGQNLYLQTCWRTDKLTVPIRVVKK